MLKHLILFRASFSFLILTVALSIGGCASSDRTPENACLKRRGAIDIGSGSTKAFAAVVDVCQNPKRIVEKLFDEKVKISFGEAVEKSSDGTFPPEVVTDASAKVATFAEQMNQKNLESLTIVATAAFRKAKNGADVAGRISEAIRDRMKGKTKLDLATLRVQILSQEQEAEVGAQSALTNLPTSAGVVSNSPIVVWDIGGGSMQMWSAPVSTANSPPAAPHLFTGDLASVTFKNKVIQDIQKKNPAEKKSPNPLKADSKKAVAVSRAHAKSNVPEFFKTGAKKARWIGIGGVLAISVQKQVEKESGAPHASMMFTENDLAKTLEKRSPRKDDEIESDYRETEITNLALVLGYMQELGIEKVETVEASLVQGLIAR